ncbi:SNF1-interacting protein, partial [Elasticomyces elasticus]
MAAVEHPAPPDAGRLINLLPTTLREAALDSPTSRATLQHYYEQVDFLCTWLDDYLKATNRLHAEHITLENVISHLTSSMVLPERVSETMLDHDYSVLAMKRAGEGAREFYMGMIGVVKRLPILVCEPIRKFQQEELSGFKSMKSRADIGQRTYDELQKKYMAMGRNKEPSAIREEAFQLHEARKVYLKAVMDVMAAMPVLRGKVDKLFIKIFCGQWNEMKTAREGSATVFDRSSTDMQRVRGWVREMEHSESSFQKELVTARKQLEEDAELASRPSRELDEYSAYTVAALSGHAHTTSNTNAILTKSPTKAHFKNGERAGWLFLRTYAGKPIRTAWVKKWAFVRNGVFGWLVRNTTTGGVEESERLGVLLCAVRPAPHEERRFCFELRTTKNVVMLQAETQADIAAWISAFESAKKKAVDEPGSSDGLTGLNAPNTEPAFSISQPPVPEFGTNVLALTEPSGSDDLPERTGTLPIPGTDPMRSSIDVRRDTISDSAARISSKFGLDRKTSTIPQMTSTPSLGGSGGGIASLIAASHGSMPVGPSLPLVFQSKQDTMPRSSFILSIRDMPPSSLAPSTLANVPAPTSLSKAAVAASGERGLHGKVTGRFGIPNGLLANTWGSSNTSFVNRFDKSELRVVSDQRPTLQPSPMLAPFNPILKPPSGLAALAEEPSRSAVDLSTSGPLALTRSRTPSPTKRHRNTISFDKNISRTLGRDVALPDYPASYPLQLKTQDAQFRLLFPNVRRDERLTLVFRATWNPSGNQDFPGRAYVTTKEMYFYSNHFGLVLTSGVSLSSVDEVTAAPGKDCDFLFVHFKDTSINGTTRVTIKTFLEPLKLLQRRLNFLVKNAQDERPQNLEQVIQHLLGLEKEVLKRSPSLESWEEFATDTPTDNAHSSGRARATTSASISEFRSPLRIDRSLRESITTSNTAFKLPAQPVRYVPPGYTHLALSREYDISPKALFHVMFGDRSALWQLLQHERRATNLKQGPWSPVGEGRL